MSDFAEEAVRLHQVAFARYTHEDRRPVTITVTLVSCAALALILRIGLPPQES